MATLISLPLLLGACGQHHSAADVPHSTGPQDVVLRLTEGPGMGTAQTFFSEPPVLVVTGAGTAYLRGEEVTAQGIVWPIFRFQAGERGVQVLLHEADREGLLATPPDYSPPSPISDGGDTTVALAVDGGRWTHGANGLGSGDESGARGRLADYVAFLDRWARTPRRPSAPEIQPTALRVLAQEVPPDSVRGADTVGHWPADTAVDPAAIGDCTVVRDPVVVRRLTTAGARYYREDGHLYEVAAAVLLPGESCGSGPAS